MGLVSGYVCLADFLIACLTIGRTNGFLSLVGLESHDAAWLHILSSWLALFWCVHLFQVGCQMR